MRIDEILPKTHGREAHVIPVTGPTDAVLRAAEQVTWKEVPKTSTLMRKKKHGDLTVFTDISEELKFRELDRSADETVMGTVLRLPFGTPVALTGSGSSSALDAFRAFAKKGHVKVAFNFHHDGTRLTTKTLVQGTSPLAAALFRLGWLAIRLPSGMTRKEWLRAIRQRLDGAGAA